MKIHEYQAQSLLKEYGVPVPEGLLAATPEEAANAAQKIGFPAVLKAQVHSGGRGKAGGIKVVKTREEAFSAAMAILGLSIQGLPVRMLWVVRATGIASELYLGLLLDRSTAKRIFLGSAAGGMEIEETARTAPEKIFRLEIPPGIPAPGLEDPFRSFASKLLGDAAHSGDLAGIMAAMDRLYREKDCSLVEINPLVITRAGGLMALDAKILLDDNALFRQAAVSALRDPLSEDPAEAEAKEAGLSYIGLAGDIGCIVNGAGLAMATMDTIQHFGGSPANFLDVGGSSNPRKITKAFELILRNPRVKVILMNIFGGITRCDDVARGIMAAKQECGFNLPVIVRLVGTNEKEGQALLTGQDLASAATLEEGARLAVKLRGTK